MKQNNLLTISVIILTLLIFGGIFYLLQELSLFIINNYNIIFLTLIIFVIVVIITTTIIIIRKNNKIISKNYSQQKNLNQLNNNNDYENIEEKEELKEHKYKLKTQTITDNEKYFLNIIKKHFAKDFDIRVQVPLSNIIEKIKNYSREYQNELNRIIDIGIFDKDTTIPLLLIEINDSTHEQKRRKERDNKVKEICEDAGIKLINFWLKYSNTEQYIVERISKNLNNQDSEK